MQLPLLSLDAVQTISEICLGCTTVLSAGTVHTHSFDVQAGFVSPFSVCSFNPKKVRRSHGYRRCSSCNGNIQSRE